MPRPRALDELKRREICALVSAGCGIAEAARYVGCNPVTIRREALRNAEFHEQLRNAELRAELSPLQALRQAAHTHWRAAAWFLERTQPDRFGRRNPDTVTPQDVDQLITEMAELIRAETGDPELCARITQRLGERVRADYREARAAQLTRRDPHRRRFPVGPRPEDFPRVKARCEGEAPDEPATDARDAASVQPPDQPGPRVALNGDGSPPSETAALSTVEWPSDAHSAL